MSGHTKVREAKRELLGALARQVETLGDDEATTQAALELAAEFRRRSSSIFVTDDRQMKLV